MKIRTMTVLALVLLGACEKKDVAKTAESPPAEKVVQSDAYQPIADYVKHDQRQPVPLQPMMAWHQKQNMMEHLVAIQRITGGLAKEDWEEIASASALIEPSAQMQKMCEHMGAGAEGFTALALDFHNRASAIGEAARAHDSAAVLSATSNTLQACTGCHATYRQDIVSAKEWELRTGSAHTPAAH